MVSATDAEKIGPVPTGGASRSNRGRSTMTATATPIAPIPLYDACGFEVVAEDDFWGWEAADGKGRHALVYCKPCPHPRNEICFDERPATPRFVRGPSASRAIKDMSQSPLEG